MEKDWSERHTLRLYSAPWSDEVSIVVQAPTEHCGLDVYLFRKNFADMSVCECVRGNETMLQMLLRRDRYAEAREASREATGGRQVDASYSLGRRAGRKDVKMGKVARTLQSLDFTDT
jgi:hypothetical protein